MQLIYSLAYADPTDIAQYWEEIVVPQFEEYFNVWESFEMKRADLENKNPAIIEEFVPKVRNFMSYVEKTWIGTKVGDGKRGWPRFPHSKWSQYSNVLEEIATTNNSVEAWNSAYNRLITSKDPSFWQI